MDNDSVFKLRNLLNEIGEYRESSDLRKIRINRDYRDKLRAQIGSQVDDIFDNREHAFKALDASESKIRLAGIIALTQVFDVDARTVQKAFELLANDPDLQMKEMSARIIGSYYQGSHDSNVEAKLLTLLRADFIDSQIKKHINVAIRRLKGDLSPNEECDLLGRPPYLPSELNQEWVRLTKKYE